MEPRHFVIPDIHGCALTFQALIEKRLQVRRTDRVYLLGDLIDRGPRTRDVLDILIEWTRRGFMITSLRGNHEQMLLDAEASNDAMRTWLLNGGHATLDSFGINRPAEIPRRYISLIESFPYYFELKNFILVHAGINLLSSNPFDDTFYMLWHRPEAADQRKVRGKRVICGHTPHDRQSIQQSLKKDFITLDNGCVYREAPEYGSLIALELESMELTFQHNLD